MLYLVIYMGISPTNRKRDIHLRSVILQDIFLIFAEFTLVSVFSLALWVKTTTRLLKKDVLKLILSTAWDRTNLIA